HGHPGARGEVSGPHAAAQHDVVRIETPVRGLHAAHAPPVVVNGGDLEVLEYARARVAGAFGERLRDIDRVGIAVARNVNAADHIVEMGERVERPNLAWSNHVHRQAEYLRHGGVALQLLHAAGGRGERDGAALPVAGRLAG